MENIVEIKIEDENGIIFCGKYDAIFDKISKIKDKNISFDNSKHLRMYINYIKTIENKDE